MKNKNFLALGIVLALTTTGAALTYANTGTFNFSNKKFELTEEQKAQFEEIKSLMEKSKDGETLTQEEQAKLDELKSNMQQRGPGKFEGDKGRKGGFGFGGFMGQDLTDEDKASFEAKRSEELAKIEAKEAVIDKLLNGETLTDADKAIVEEIKAERAKFKAQKAEMEEIRSIMEKSRKGETLTTEEQAKLDEMKVNVKKGEGPRQGKKLNKEKVSE